MRIELDKRFRKKAHGLFEKYEFDVGILKDGPHKDAQPLSKGLKSFAGGPARKTSNKSSMSISEVSERNRKRMRVNYLIAPFKKRSSDIIKFSNEFFKLAFGRSEKRRCETLLQAIVRNPILRGDYGSNSAVTKKIKGFDRLMIDTAQLFKSIISKVRVKGV